VTFAFTGKLNKVTVNQDPTGLVFEDQKNVQQKIETRD
jgi:hypothetical protein